MSHPVFCFCLDLREKERRVSGSGVCEYVTSLEEKYLLYSVSDPRRSFTGLTSVSLMCSLMWEAKTWHAHICLDSLRKIFTGGVIKTPHFQANCAQWLMGSPRPYARKKLWYLVVERERKENKNINTVSISSLTSIISIQQYISAVLYCTLQ